MDKTERPLVRHATHATHESGILSCVHGEEFRQGNRNRDTMGIIGVQLQAGIESSLVFPSALMTGGGAPLATPVSHS